MIFSNRWISGIFPPEINYFNKRTRSTISLSAEIKISYKIFFEVYIKTEINHLIFDGKTGCKPASVRNVSPILINRQTSGEGGTLR